MAYKKCTIFTSFLNELKVPHTKEYSDKFFNEHPYNDTLYGLSKLLRDYHIPNNGYKFEGNKDSIVNELKPPFIAQIGFDFIPVYDKTEGWFKFWRNGRSLQISLVDFVKMWSGNILFANPNSESTEPNYKRHRILHFIKIVEYIIFIISFLYSFFFLCKLSLIKENISTILVYILNIIGLITTYILIRRDDDLSDSFAESVCSLFKHSDCNSVIQSSASRFLGIISWGQIGLGYFISNLIVLTFIPEDYFYYCIFNMLTLPYTFWSIWYQKYKAQAWCPLCLIVQVILWILFICNIFVFNRISLESYSWMKCLHIFFLYVASVLAIHLLFSNMTFRLNLKYIEQRMNRIRLKDHVFYSIMRDQRLYKISQSDSHILCGNIESSNVLTIISNPHCNPCALLHERLNTQVIKENFCIQYLYSSFAPEFDISSKFLIAVYFQSPEKERESIYNEWYRDGRRNKNKFFKKYSKFQIDKQVDDEYAKQTVWMNKHAFSGTPIILINGYLLNEDYKIEDLQYFLADIGTLLK